MKALLTDKPDDMYRENGTAITVHFYRVWLPSGILVCKSLVYQGRGYAAT